MTRDIGHPEANHGGSGRQGQCQRCGACCANVGRPRFSAEEMGNLPADVRYVAAWFQRHDPHRDDYVTPCYFLDVATRKCLIYAHRPQVCRDFRPGGHLCQELRRAFVPCLDKFNEDMRTRH